MSKMDSVVVQISRLHCTTLIQKEKNVQPRKIEEKSRNVITFPGPAPLHDKGHLFGSSMNQVLPWAGAGAPTSARSLPDVHSASADWGQRNQKGTIGARNGMAYPPMN
ncbi:unnamed protein product [Boreogadus saida]